MEEQSLTGLALELGLDGEYENIIEDSGVSFSQAAAGDVYEDIDDLIEQYENSSPSPPERCVASSLRNRPFNLQFTRQLIVQPPFQRNRNTNRIDNIGFYETQPLYQTGLQPTTGLSSYRSPNFNRHSYPVQSVSRTSFTQPVTSLAYTQHEDQSPYSSLPDALSVVNRFGRPAERDPPLQMGGSNPRNTHGIRLRPVSDLPDIYRGLFRFGVFNAVQSKCYDTVMHSDENMVISAPTGSGKTVLFELAIIRMLMRGGVNSKTSKCIYVAPTKALCSEKCREWTAKFQALGINCCELTGDTVQFGKSAWGNARDATIIVTTGEKWDSLTRNWRDHGQILSQIQLFLVDEVHILNESRGSTLEVIISRMKSRGSSVRFVVVSATVPNIEDVASWIGDGTRDGSATVMQFGEDFRPCKLSRFVYGIARKKDQNDFAFQKTLDYRLFSIIQQHTANKPVLVFCSTRKSVISSADLICKQYEEAMEKKQTLPWSRPARIDQIFQNKRLEKLAQCGIGIHHAGLSMDDRRATEDLYIKKSLHIVFATSTLAVGVNLPAHTVIIKGVKIYQNNASQEYSDLDIMQMMGRAGRPQFDKEGVAIIMCEPELEAKYNALVQGRTLLESCLHLNLSEHINSEVGLGTIVDMSSAKEWLHNSFLFRRIQKNSRHYAIDKDSGQTWQERIDEMVTQSISRLQETGLVEYAGGDTGELGSTEFGDIMSKFYVKQYTMGLILKLSERSTLKDVLETISNAEEFSDIKIRGGEKQIYNKMRTHNDIRFHIKKVDKPADKIFLLIQAVLGCINLSDSEWKSGDNNPYMEALLVFRHVTRIAKSIVEVAIVKKAGGLLKYSLEALRCLNAKAWEDRHVVMRQVEHIGEKSLKVLAEHNITSLGALRKQDPLRIEVLLNRRPPFGHEVIAAAEQFPQYSLQITETSIQPHGGKRPVELELSIECGLLNCSAMSAKSRKAKTKIYEMTNVLTLTSDLEFIDFRRIPTVALKDSKSFALSIELVKPSQSIVVTISSEAIAGVTISESYKPKVDPKLYPTLDTKPQTSMDILLEGLENVEPDFWNMDLDDEEPPMQAESSKNDSLVKSSAPSKTSVKKLLASDTSQNLHLGFRKLPNGNYECNHTCKDKTKCRHLCCHEGISKPPPMSKKRVAALCADQDSQIATGSAHKTGENWRLPPRPNPKVKPCDKPDIRLQHLDALHEQTNVQANLGLSSTQSIKLSGGGITGTGLKRKRTSDSASTLLNGAVILEVVDSDDDLPDPHDILNEYSSTKRKRRGDSSDTHYSNSELDALIRDAPLDFYPNPLPVSSISDYGASTNSRPGQPVCFTPPDKRKRTMDDTSPLPIKQSKAQKAGSPLPPNRLQNTDAGRFNSLQGEWKEEALFIPSDNDNYSTGVRAQDRIESPVHCFNASDDEDEFTLNSSLLEIIPDASAATVSLLPPTTTTWEGAPGHRDVSAKTLEEPSGPPSEDGRHVKKQQQVLVDEDENEDNGYDQFIDELEAWLHSDAVRIIDKPLG